ncbi:protein of unknown function [Candidatus Nitrosotalea okcheonensis]|uniref:Fibronectin type-III domain-containing protein n=1 Tax=Candidatus Nitrosotalea okcheonensis TaxID=1903276 RepID=A0A2H1FF99_9ARCH|nr:protein of unknown function [Candidatus Nitrosotalea okcheonensis]
MYDGGLTSSPSNTASATTQSNTSTLTVSTQLITGDTLTGMYTELRNSTGQIAASSFSPATFVLKNGAQYTVGMGNFVTYIFDHWADTGSTTNPRPVSISSDTQLTAIYRDIGLVLSPSRGPAGTTVSVTGANNAYSPSTAVTLRWDGTALATITSNSTGGFSATFQVPSTATAGSHKVQATDGTHTHAALFIVGPNGPTTPQPPTSLTATTISSSQINLSWTAPSDNGGSAITGYKIERSQDNRTTWSIISSNTASTSTTYSDTGLSPSTAYAYRVSAINSVGTSVPSNIASATTQNAPVSVPQPPTNLTASAVSSSQINLSWTAPSNNGSSPLTGYKIERSQDNRTTWSIISSNTASTSTTYSDTGLSPSTAYAYRVSAINSVGTSVPSNIASATTQNAATLLSPTGLTASAVSSSQISLNWNAPSNSGSLVTGYMIERSSDGGITWSTKSNTGTSSTIYLDSGLSPSTTYTYRVSAMYGAEASPPSNTASATTQSSTYKLTVSTQLSTGDTLTGMYTELRNSTGQIAASSFSPATFVLKNGAQYTVGMGNFVTYIFDHWADTGSTTNPRPVSISSDTQLTAIYRDIGLVLSPSRGPAGTTVSVTGANNAYSPSTAVTLRWDGTALATITSNSTGGFSATFQVPSTATAGSHKVQATDGTHTHAALFIVGSSSAIALSNTSGNAGDLVKVTGTNFLPYSRITLYFDNTSLSGIRVGQGGGFAPNSNPASIETDSSGNFVADIQIFDRPTGSYNVKATDQSDSDTKSFTIAPGALLFNPTSGHAGTAVNFRASGFAASSVIAITLDGVPVVTSPASITSDLVGEFQGSFTVPTTSTIGLHQVQISDSGGNKYSNSFNVTSSSTPMFNVKTLVSGLSSPVGMAFIPDNGPGKDGSGNFMVIEQNGTVIVVKNNGGTFVTQAVPFVKIPNVQVYADAGLLGIAFDPNWVNTKLVYFYSTLNVAGVVKNEVFRYHATTDSSGNIIADTSVGQQIIVDKIPADVDHDGGHMKFDSQGNLYISTGDNYGYTASQDLTSLAGKLLKITPLASPNSNGLLYSIPSTNPFATNPNSSIRKEIYSYGIRNTFNFDIDSQTGKIYFDHVGQSAWESIVDTTNPVNLGWSNYEGPTVGNPQNVTNYKEPLYWYPHQGLEPTTGFAKDLEAITGGVFYHGSAYPSNLQGAYFFGDYGAGYIAALLSTDKNPPQADPVTGVPKGQVQTIMSGLTLAPTDMQVWNGEIYYVNLTGSISVLNYS